MKQLKRFTAIPSIAVFALLLASCALLQTAQVQPSDAAEQKATKVTSVEGITEYQLDNGLRFLLFPDQSSESFTVIITYFVGSLHEGYGETGMAHLLEHLVFRGSAKFPDISAALTEHGASPNGTTWYDRTNYFETLVATRKNLEFALDLESDRMVNSFITREDLDAEMSVVRNEWEIGENSPGRVLSKRLRSTAFDWHNYGNSTIGARADIESVPIDRLKAFYQKYYQPDNALLMVAGKFDEQETIDLIVEKFGLIPRPDRTGSNQLFRTYTAEPAQDGERMVTLERVGDIQLVYMGYHIPAGSSEEYVACDVLAFVLGSGPSSRLYKALIEPQIASGASAYADQFKEPGLLTVSASVAVDKSLEEATRVMNETIEDILVNPPTEEEVERAKTAYLSNIERAFNNPQQIAMTMSEVSAGGDWRLFFLYRDRLEKVTVEDVHEAAKQYLKRSNRTIAFFKPVEEVPPRAEIPATPDVSELVAGYVGGEAVQAGEAFDPTPANIQARTEFRTLSNGAKLALLPKTTRGAEVLLRFVLRYGTEQALMGKSATAQLTGSMPMRGTTSRTKQEIADEFDRLKVFGSFSARLNIATGAASTIRENLPDAIRLLAEIATEPAFDEEEFDLLKSQILVNLESQQSEPGPLANIAFSKHLDQYPRGHPNYASSIEESIEDLSQVTLEDAKSFYDEFVGFGPGTTISVVGDFDADEIANLLEEEFGDWVSSAEYVRVASDAQGNPAKSISIETPDKTNAVMYAGFNFPFKDSHPDYEAMLIGNYIFGGGFLNSRLAVRIREKEGLSYSVGAGFNAHPIDNRGTFSASASFPPDKYSKVVTAFKEELDLAIEEGFTDEEVEKAISGYLDARKRSRASDGVIANFLNSHQFFGRTMEFTQAQEDKIAALTTDDVNSAFQKHIDADKVTIVLAGDFASVDESATSEVSE